MLREFIKLEASAGIVLFLAAVFALIVDNTPLHTYYHALFNVSVTVQFGKFGLSKPLLHWINDGFMAIFFFLVGLEIKRELFEGELNSFAKAILPGIAAIGGMIVPAFIFILFNSHDAIAIQGWAIPTATDIAFSLGVLSLLGSRIPISLKIFLMALAIFDDLAAIIIIAFFYGSHFSYLFLSAAILTTCFLIALNYFQY